MKQKMKTITDKEFIKNIPKEMIDDNGDIRPQMDQNTSMNRIAKDIYKDPIAAVREYINNVARPCRKAISLGHDASIHVTIDPNKRTITIEDIDSMGMSRKTFENTFVYIGRTDNDNEMESGQFGFGRLSYVSIADEMRFETHVRETGEKYGFTAAKDFVFSSLEKKDLTIKKFGTKVTMTIRDDIPIGRIARYVEKVGGFLGVPIYRSVTSAIVGWDSVEQGRTKVGPLDVKEYLKLEGSYLNAWIDIDREDYRFCGYVTNNIFSAKIDSRLVGIPIDFDTDKYHNSLSFQISGNFMINIKNERKYLPTASRDSLITDSSNKLVANITDEIERMVNGQKLIPFDKFDINGKGAFAVISDNLIYKKHKNDKKIDPEIVKYVRTLCEYVTINDKETFKKTRIHDNHFYVALANYDKVFFLKTRNRQIINIILKSIPNSAVVTPTTRRNVHNYNMPVDDLFEVMEKYGLMNAAKYVKDNNLKKSLGDAGTAKPVTVHGIIRESASISVMMSTELDSAVISIPRNINIRHIAKDLAERAKIDHKINIVKETHTVNKTNVTPLAKAISDAREHLFDTNIGKISGSDIIQKYPAGFALYDDCVVEDAKIMTPEMCAREFEYDGIIVLDHNKENIQKITALFLAYDTTASITHIHHCEKERITNRIQANKMGINADRNISSGMLAFLNFGTKNMKTDVVKKMYQEIHLNSNPAWPNHLYLDTSYKFFKVVDDWMDGKDPVAGCVELIKMKTLEANIQHIEDNYDIKDGVPLFLKETAMNRIRKMYEISDSCSREFLEKVTSLLDGNDTDTKIEHFDRTKGRSVAEDTYSITAVVNSPFGFDDTLLNTLHIILGSWPEQKITNVESIGNGKLRVKILIKSRF